MSMAGYKESLEMFLFWVAMRLAKTPVLTNVEERENRRRGQVAVSVTHGPFCSLILQRQHLALLIIVSQRPREVSGQINMVNL